MRAALSACALVLVISGWLDTWLSHPLEAIAFASLAAVALMARPSGRVTEITVVLPPTDASGRAAMERGA